MPAPPTAKRIEMWPLDRLVPYEKNARTHSPAQIQQIAASITEFGFTNPILVDGADGILAGHGRLAAAKDMGLALVPVQDWQMVSKSMRRIGVKDCICSDCGTEFTVRRDQKPVVCRLCASRRGGNASGGPRTARTECAADGCTNTFRASYTYTYCSVACRKISKRQARTCKGCKTNFTILSSCLSNKTNSSGNFCNRKCYEKWMCDTERTKHYGSQWRKRRGVVVRAIPFCAVCGTSKSLDVHHIAPYRVSNDNDQDNLIPLCKKDHKRVEILTVELLALNAAPEDVKMVFGSILREHQAATFQYLKSIGYRGNYEHQFGIAA